MIQTQTVLLGLVGLLGYVVYYCVAGLRANLVKARASGIPYIVVPCTPHAIPWLIVHRPIMYMAEHFFPRAWWAGWLPTLVPDWTWRAGREMHDASKGGRGDMLMLVSPFGFHVFVCRAEALAQLAAARERFPKDAAKYAIITLFGRNLIASEGAEWRAHRKVTTASFNDRNTALVFREAVRQALGMLDYWRAGGENGHHDNGNGVKAGTKENGNGIKENGVKEKGTTGQTLHTVEQDTARLALNIIGYAGFGLRLPWPNQPFPDDATAVEVKYGSVQPPAGYSMTFGAAMTQVLQEMFLLMLVPPRVMRHLPFDWVRAADAARNDYVRYVDEMLEHKRRQVHEGTAAAAQREGMDIMGQLVRSSYEPDPSPGADTAQLKPGAPLSRSDITGNAFIMMVAGHETTANLLHFSLLQLASHPGTQRRLHADLDELLPDTDAEGRPVDWEDLSSWDYERHADALMDSMAGAVMNETLRVLPPVVEIPRIVAGQHDQAIRLDGRDVVLPAGATLILSAAGVHMNPRHWPAEPSREREGEDDLADFVPERWFRSSTGVEDAAVAAADAEAKAAHDDLLLAEDKGEGSHLGRQLFRPERGAFIPFSDGPRACIGRRIAQVEVLATLAAVMRHYSVELAVDEWATDEAVEGMGRGEREEVYWKARDKFYAGIKESTSRVTLKMRRVHVPIRLVRRGEERFVSWMGEV